MFNYDSVQPTVKFSIKEFIPGVIPFASFFGNYIYNLSLLRKDATGESGFDMGIKLGEYQVSDWKQWQTRVVYSKLGRDSWLDIFPDSDRYGGKTNSQVWEAIFDYGLGKNTWITLDYYATSLSRNGDSGKTPEHIFQVDWNMKF